MTEQPQPFRLLPNEEFLLLSTDEKVAYLTRAIEAATREAPVVAVLIPPPPPSDPK